MNVTQIQPWAPPRFTNAGRAEEQRVCYEMRLRGLSIRAIAAETGLSVGTVYNRIDCEITETLDPLRSKVRELEIERLDRMQLTVLNILDREHYVISDGRVVTRIDAETDEKVPIPDPGPVFQAIDRLLKIAERRARLLGLDAPTKVDTTVTDVTQIDPDTAAMIADAKAMAEAQEAAIKARREQTGV